VKDKKILSVPFSTSNAFVSTVIGGMKKVAGEVGLKLDIYENTGQKTQWVQGIELGINQHYDLIDLFAPDLLSLVPQAMAAKAAGIPVVSSHDGGVEQKRPEPYQSVPAKYKDAGRLLAEWVILNTEGKANVLVLGPPESFSTASLLDGIKGAFADCETCKAKYINIPNSDWSTRIQPTVQAALLADPTINFVLPVNDPMVQYVVPAIELTQSGDRVKIASYNGTPFTLDFVREGKADMIIGENLDWFAHAIIDAEMRIVCGLKPVTDPQVPLRIFDKTNIADVGNPATYNAGYGDAYVEGYRKLWKLQ
jgi:ribose transport system substrate-binding protein